MRKRSAASQSASVKKKKLKSKESKSKEFVDSLPVKGKSNTSLVFTAKHIKLWYQILERHYYNSADNDKNLNVDWRDTTNTSNEPSQTIIKVACSAKERNLSVVITLYNTTHTIMVQGSTLDNWMDMEYPVLERAYKDQALSMNTSVQSSTSASTAVPTTTTTTTTSVANTLVLPAESSSYSHNFISANTNIVVLPTTELDPNEELDLMQFSQDAPGLSPVIELPTQVEVSTNPPDALAHAPVSLVSPVTST